MDLIDSIRGEIISSRSWFDRALKDIPADQWKVSPSGFHTNVNWQVGHIIIGTYFHGISSVHGLENPIKPLVDLKFYASHYRMGSEAQNELEIKPDKIQMISDLDAIDKGVIELLSNLKNSDLDQPVHTENPVAKTKIDALQWTIKHRMWHAGQIAMIKSHLKEL